MRTFIAIDLPAHIKSKVFHEFETLQKKNFFKGTFVNKDSLHLTLKFLGDVSEENIENVKKTLNEIKLKNFKCSIGKTGVFDNEDHIKVLWVEVLSDRLDELHKVVSNKFLNFPNDYEKFSPHITLARVKEVANKKDLVEYLKKLKFKKLDFNANEILLMKSDLTREGPIYKVLERINLT